MFSIDTNTLAYNNNLISFSNAIVIIFVSLTIVFIITLAYFTWFIRPNSSKDPWKGYEVSDEIYRVVQTSFDYVN
jgi:hypothetical protein